MKTHTYNSEKVDEEKALLACNAQSVIPWHHQGSFHVYKVNFMKQASKVTLLFQDIYSQTYLKTNKQDQFKKKQPNKKNKQTALCSSEGSASKSQVCDYYKEMYLPGKRYNLTLQIGPYGKAPCPLRPTAKSEEP